MQLDRSIFQNMATQIKETAKTWNDCVIIFSQYYDIEFLLNPIHRAVFYASSIILNKNDLSKYISKEELKKIIYESKTIKDILLSLANRKPNKEFTQDWQADHVMYGYFSTFIRSFSIKSKK